MSSPSLPDRAVAYFCMEFGLDPRLPIYAGGLGILAGDTLKAARDLGVPLVGIGIFWGEGYTRQILDEHGQPTDTFVPVPRGVLRDAGAIVELRIHDRQVAVRGWWVDAYDNAPLLLLEPVEPAERWISRRLYGGNDDDRVAQELVLGVAGVRMLHALGVDVATYHFNEGHAVFAGVELLRQELATGTPFDLALQAVRDKVVFTTHTPVPAGNEIHPIDRLARAGLTDEVITHEVLAHLGGDPFEMTPAALRLASQANAVAVLHARTARTMWAHVDQAAPIHAITNGVHLGTWQDAELRRLHDEGVPDAALWARHQALKERLIDEIARRNGVAVDPDVLLVGFARRAATYKRATLILQDLQWLGPLLDTDRVQLVFSGKAHPRDEGGKALVRQISEVGRRYPGKVLFLDDYDMVLGALLTRGCDAWLNTPRRPMEASGTSGMKAAANGLLNISTLDGWWDEGCEDGVNGWAIGGRQDAVDAEDDVRDLRALQEVMRTQVLPTYYDDRARWVRMMRAAIDTGSTRFSAARMVSEYARRLYTLDG